MNMRKNKGFTLIELMVVILIVAILAAVLAPMLSGRINDAKWVEGKAGAGTIATAIRAYCAEQEQAPAAAFAAAAGAYEPIGLKDGDLAGKYFSVTCYSVAGIAYDPATGTCTYTITVNPPAGSNLTGTVTLDGTGAITGP